VEAARKRHRARFKDAGGVSCNGEMRPAEIREFCELDAAGQSQSRRLRMTSKAMRQLHLSRIEAAHLAEAVQDWPRQVI